MHPRDKTTHAYAVLKKLILNGSIERIRKMRFRDLTSLTGTSHIPVREALRTLESEGLVRFVPGKGVRLIQLSNEELRDQYLCRIALESLAASLAVVRATPGTIAKLEACVNRQEEALKAKKRNALRRANHQFHKIVCEAADVPILSDLLERLWAAHPRESIFYVPAQIEQSLTEHREILALIRDRKQREVSRAMSSHLHSAARALGIDVPTFD